ncbi:alpha/beta hydrolase-fold protein [Nocardia grenadensis]|uniref:alpha/beta hydrolase-fold protein n=1 Tax=Nocardia grenadensis TaxID=931537 RepID=UPI000A73EBBD|nr:alpha/beta hydrolase-fold protein [Nocardia grenadensis]
MTRAYGGTTGRSRGRARRQLTAWAAALVFPFAVAQAPVSAQPTAAAASPATIRNVVWHTDRDVAVWVDSPAMGAPIQVRLLLARDWNTQPDAKFPVLYMLDGLRATDDENGWIKDAGAVDFYADKNTTVVLPVGGRSSFYSDWLQPDNGKNYKWETFLTKELPPLLESQWRATSTRGIAGLSMGGTAAMFLAARNPEFVKYAASYSGFLTTTSLGMPQAIRLAMADAGGFDSGAMWGPPGSPQWEEHDPLLLADRLKGKSLYISSGTGVSGKHDEGSEIPGVSTNMFGMGLETLALLTSQNFVDKLGELRIPATVKYRAAGTHTWPYWDFEMRQSWSQAAGALGVPAAKPECAVAGAVGAVVGGNDWLGDCLTGEYQVPGGLAQDFRHGRVFYSPAGGAYPVAGRIGGGYQAAAGPSGVLGLPTGAEQPLPDGRGRFQQFRHGSLYWTPETGAQVVRGAILEEWGRQGFEGGPARYPVGPEVRTPNRDGSVQPFEGGPFYFSPATGAHRVEGTILAKYAELGFENSRLGFPAAAQVPLKDLGQFTRFEGGSIYWSPLSGAWAVRDGPLMDAWRDAGYENGRLGFPISDEFPIPGGVQQNFQRGFITIKDHHPEVHG